MMFLVNHWIILAFVSAGCAIAAMAWACCAAGRDPEQYDPYY